MQIGETMNSRSRMVVIRNDAGMEVTLCDFGASIYEIRINDKPMTIACKDFEKWMYTRSYFGKTVGRIAGRVKDAKITISGQKYHLDQNDGKNTLHTGKDALCYKPWIYDVHERRVGAVVDFFYMLQDGEEGLPGEQMINVRYIIHKKENVIDIKFIAIFVAGMLVLGFLGYVLYAAISGWKYVIRFTMTDKEIIHEQMPHQVKKAQAISMITVLAGLVSKSPGTIGTGMLAARTTSVSTFKDVKKIKAVRRSNLIKVNESLSRNQIYVEEQDFDFVYQFLCQHCPNAKHE